MNIDIECQPSYSMATVQLSRGEAIICESGAMAYMSEGLKVSSKAEGGVMKSFIRKNFGDESFFRARYEAEIEGAWVSLAPRFPGDIALINVHPGEEYLMESGSILAHSAGVETSVKYAGARALVLREGVTTLHARGEGQLLICSYGGIRQINVPQHQSLIVDTGHLVAWSADMGMQFGPLSGLVTAKLTGEGLVGKLTGPGKVWVQTRAEQSIKSWLFPKRAQNER